MDHSPHLNTRTHFFHHPQSHHGFMLETMERLKQEQLEWGKNRRKAQLDQPVSCWSEKDLLRGEPVDAFVIILRSGGCRWHQKSGCSMCGYSSDTACVSPAQLLAQLDRALERYQDQPVVKLFNSGSFLDDQDLPGTVRAAFFDNFGARAQRLILESRSNTVTQKTLDELGAVKADLEVALGLESSNNHLLKYSINKGVVFQDFVNAATLLRERGHTVKTYLLLKPPFLTEEEALEDAVLSVKDALPYSNTISINPVNIQNYTFVRYLWKEKLYRPPWLWSLVEVLKRVHQEAQKAGVRLMSSPSGAGTWRGVHNCGNCDSKIIKAVEAYSQSSDISHLQNHHCRCQELWKDSLEIGEITRSEPWLP